MHPRRTYQSSSVIRFYCRIRWKTASARSSTIPGCTYICNPGWKWSLRNTSQFQHKVLVPLNRAAACVTLISSPQYRSSLKYLPVLTANFDWSNVSQVVGNLPWLSQSAGLVELVWLLSAQPLQQLKPEHPISDNVCNRTVSVWLVMLVWLIILCTCHWSCSLFNCIARETKALHYVWLGFRETRQCLR